MKWILGFALELILAVDLRGPDVSMINDLCFDLSEHSGVVPGTRLPDFNAYPTFAFNCNSSYIYAL